MVHMIGQHNFLDRWNSTSTAIVTNSPSFIIIIIIFYHSKFLNS